MGVWDGFLKYLDDATARQRQEEDRVAAEMAATRREDRAFNRTVELGNIEAGRKKAAAAGKADYLEGLLGAKEAALSQDDKAPVPDWFGTRVPAPSGDRQDRTVVRRYLPKVTPEGTDVVEDLLRSDANLERTRITAEAAKAKANNRLELERATKFFTPADLPSITADLEAMDEKDPYRPIAEGVARQLEEGATEVYGKTEYARQKGERAKALQSKIASQELELMKFRRQKEHDREVTSRMSTITKLRSDLAAAKPNSKENALAVKGLNDQRSWFLAAEAKALQEWQAAMAYQKEHGGSMEAVTDAAVRLDLARTRREAAEKPYLAAITAATKAPSISAPTKPSANLAPEELDRIGHSLLRDKEFSSYKTINDLKNKNPQLYEQFKARVRQAIDAAQKGK